MNNPKPSKKYQEAETIIGCSLRISLLLGITKTQACCIAIDMAKNVTGVDFSPLLIDRNTGKLTRLSMYGEE